MTGAGSGACTGETGRIILQKELVASAMLTGDGGGGVGKGGKGVGVFSTPKTIQEQ